MSKTMHPLLGGAGPERQLGDGVGLRRNALALMRNMNKEARP